MLVLLRTIETGSAVKFFASDFCQNLRRPLPSRKLQSDVRMLFPVETNGLNHRSMPGKVFDQAYIEISNFPPRGALRSVLRRVKVAQQFAGVFKKNLARCSQ